MSLPSGTRLGPYEVAAAIGAGGAPAARARRERAGVGPREPGWLAYSSSESGRREVYVETFPASGRRWQISTNYGRRPRWRPDGKELFFIGRDDVLTAVALAGDGTAWRGSPPRPLFRLPVIGSDILHNYVVSADGQRFLANTLIEGAPISSVTVVLNWRAALNK